MRYITHEQAVAEFKECGEHHKNSWWGIYKDEVIFFEED